MEHEKPNYQTQANQRNIPNNPSTIHRASDEVMRHESISINNSSLSNE
jgi:hypothetical protein